MENLRNFDPLTEPWTGSRLPELNRYFESRSPEVLLQAAAERFGDRLVMATGFGPSGVVLMHLLSQAGLQIPVFYLQTDLLFPETLALRDRLRERFGLQFIEVHCGLSLDDQARQYGPNLWQSNPDLCCHLRKVVPLRRFLADKEAWITGIRRDQSTSRANIRLIDWDRANGLIKLNPLAGWTKRQVWTHIVAHNLPYNSLHDRGYPSIGCHPCTRPVNADEPERAGRWPGRAKTECGIHLQDTGDWGLQTLQLTNSQTIFWRHGNEHLSL